MNAKTQANAIAKAIATLDTQCWQNGIEDVKAIRKQLFSAMLMRGYIFAAPNSVRTRAVTKKDHALWREHMELVAMRESIIVEVSVSDGCGGGKYSNYYHVGTTDAHPKANFLKDWEACKSETETWSTDDLIAEMRDRGWVINTTDTINADIKVDA